MGHYLSEMGPVDHSVWPKPMYLWSKAEREEFRKRFIEMVNKKYKEKYETNTR
jgi:hypothetical protein